MQTDIEAIEQALIDMLARYAPPDKVIVPATRMVGDLGLESVRIMEFVVDVEDHFDVIIDIEGLADVHTVGDLARVVARARKGS